MKRYLHISFICFALALLAWLLMGYATPQARFHEIITIPHLEVHLVSSPLEYDYIPYRLPLKNGGVVTGYAFAGSKIYMVCPQRADGSFVPDLLTLGHELGHILRHHNKRVIDPDKYLWWEK
jgi:hypothetical protein